MIVLYLFSRWAAFGLGVLLGMFALLVLSLMASGNEHPPEEDDSEGY